MYYIQQNIDGDYEIVEVKVVIEDGKSYITFKIVEQISKKDFLKPILDSLEEL